MAMWLVKEEPGNYNFETFAKDGGTTWTGVKNPLAQKHLRGIRKGDLVFYYHTGDEKSVVGIAKASGDAYPDPADKTGKAHVVDLVPGETAQATGHARRGQSRQAFCKAAADLPAPVVRDAARRVRLERDSRDVGTPC